MEIQYFMRVRGRVLGPYDEEKLQTLARRGQLSRMHEISTDGVDWKRAASFPDLFSGAIIETLNVNVQEVHTAESNRTETTAAVGNVSPQAQWYYTSGGTQRGPVDYSQLQLLIAAGQLSSVDQVWTEGMPNWVSASTIPGLRQGAGIQTDDATSSTRVPLSVVKAAVGCRPWAMVVAAVIDVMAAITLIGNFMLLIVGARAGAAGVVGSAIVGGLHAIVWIIWGLLLHNYCRKLAALSYRNESAVLEKSHDALRAFWIYTAIYLIVCVTFVTVAAVYIFAAGVTFPRLQM